MRCRQLKLKPEEDVLVMVTDIFDEKMFVDPTSFSGVDTQTMKNLSNLVQQLNNVVSTIADKEEELKELRAEKQRLSIDIIPQVMDEMGTERVDVEGGSVSLRPFISASIPKDEEKKQKAFDCLREYGLGSIIKNDVVLTFEKGEDNVAKSLIADLEQKGFEPETKTHVHPSTLKATLRTCVEDGKPIDLDPFNAFIARTAVITAK